MDNKDKNTIITSHNQMGGITAHTVNLAPKPRQMSEQLTMQMKQHIPRNATVRIVAVLGDAEAIGFANQVLNWLKSNSYSEVSGVDQAVYSEPMTGQVLNKKSETEYEIIIGTKQT